MAPPSHAAAIMAKLSKTGAAAGKAKRRQVLSTPPHKPASEMKPRYGNIQRVMNTAASSPRGFCFKPLAIAHTSRGAASTPAKQVSTRTHASTVATRSISNLVASSPS